MPAHTMPRCRTGALLGACLSISCMDVIIGKVGIRVGG
jgi:hypothetical protein